MPKLFIMPTHALCKDKNIVLWKAIVNKIWQNIKKCQCLVFHHMLHGNGIPEKCAYIKITTCS